MNRIILFTSASSFYIFSSAHHIFEFSLDILLEYFEGCLWKCTWVTETGSAPFLRICCFTTPSAGTAPSPESATPSPTISACSARAPPMSSPSGSASQSPGPKVLSCNIQLTTQFAIIIQITISEDFVCSLPHDSGGCDRKEFRYYYNSLEVRH